jgi:rubrerythrin
VSRERDIAVLQEALALEREAVARYVAHSQATPDPRLFAYWESLRRNEAEHRDLLVAQLSHLGVSPATAERANPALPDTP